MSTIKRRLSGILTVLFGGILVPVVFPVVRYMKDQAFLRQLGNSSLRPSPLAAPLVLIVRAGMYIARTYRRCFDDYALRRYFRFVKHHYSKDGRGYFSYDGLSDAEKAALYGQPDGRVRGFIETYADLLGYRDGDSFFDAGCGRGQNVKVLRTRFPNSPVLAKDVSAEAVSTIDAATASPLLTTGTMDLLDPAALSDIGDGAYDHVVISHVLSVILGDGLSATKEVRQRIVSDLIRISRRSLLIIDSPDIVAEHERFEIEQKDRGWFVGSLRPCFAHARGRLLILQAGDSVGLLFQPGDIHA